MASTSSLALSNKNRKLTLHSIPPEIRQMIFQHCVDWDGDMPAIIKALRGQRDQTMYFEALSVMYRTSTFFLSMDETDSCVVERNPAISRIQKLSIYMEHSWASSNTIIAAYPVIDATPNLRELHLDIQFDYYPEEIPVEIQFEILYLFQIPHGLPHLREVSIKIPDTYSLKMIEETSFYGLDFGLFISLFNQCFGVPGRLLSVRVQDDSNFSSDGEDTWFWKVERGKAFRLQENITACSETDAFWKAAMDMDEE